MKWPCYFDKTKVASCGELLSHYTTKEFQSPTRSTIPLLSLLKDENEILQDVLCYINVSRTAEVHLEFTVKPQAGRGKASHTDAMIITEMEACAIESKWTEPPYVKVINWFKSGSDLSNRQAVMNGWLRYLQPYATRPLCLNDFSGSVYQMVHRAASVCSLKKKPRLVYLQFISSFNKAKHIQNIKNELNNLYCLLGSPSDFPMYFIEINAEPTNDYLGVMGLPKKSAQTEAAVRYALNGKAIFTFTLQNVHKMTGTAL